MMDSPILTHGNGTSNGAIRASIESANDVVRRLIMEKLELEALNHDSVRDLRRSDFLINDLQDSLNTLREKAESAKKKLAEAETRIAGLSYISYSSANPFSLNRLSSFADLSEYLDRMASAANYTAGFINARGVIPLVKLYDVPNRIREVAAHGAHHGVAIALAAAHIQSGHDLRHAPTNFFPERSGEYEWLIKGYFNMLSPIHFSTLYDDIISRVFSNP